MLRSNEDPILGDEEPGPDKVKVLGGFLSKNRKHNFARVNYDTVATLRTVSTLRYFPKENSVRRHFPLLVYCRPITKSPLTLGCGEMPAVRSLEGDPYSPSSAPSGLYSPRPYV